LKAEGPTDVVLHKCAEIRAADSLHDVPHPINIDAIFEATARLKQERRIESFARGSRVVVGRPTGRNPPAKIVLIEHIVSEAGRMCKQLQDSGLLLWVLEYWLSVLIEPNEPLYASNFRHILLDSGFQADLALFDELE
jgi:hypothetical protein